MRFQDFINPTSLHEGFLDVTNSQISAFSQNVTHLLTALYQFNGVRLLAIGLFVCVVSAMPYRRGEKWAWYLLLCAGGFSVVGDLVVLYLYSSIMNTLFIPANIFMVVIWLIGIILPAKQIFKR